MDRPDDARHAVLAKARRPTQTSVLVDAADWTWEPPGERGTYEILEVDARSALTHLGLPGGGWSLNPYTGCSHACLYCYVPDVTKVERPRWGSYVIAKRNLPALLAHEVRRKDRKHVFVSSATDPYQPAEGDLQITRMSLEVLARADWPVGVLTRSPLALRDVDLFRRFSEFEIGLSVPTLDDDARRVLEPAAPPIPGRLKALRRLSDLGFDTFVNFAPAYPLTGGVAPDHVAQAYADAGVRRVYASPWNYLENLRGPLRGRVRGTPLESFPELVEEDNYYRRLFKLVGAACARHGVHFEAMTSRFRNGPALATAAIKS